MKNTYWAGNGKYQAEYDKLYDTLVPDKGMAETTDGEALRSVSKLYYDLYNNGAGNWYLPFMRWLWSFLMLWLEKEGLTVNKVAIEQEFELQKDIGWNDEDWVCDEGIDFDTVASEMEAIADAVISRISGKNG